MGKARPEYSGDAAALAKGLKSLEVELRALEREQAQGGLKQPHRRRILRRERARTLTKLRAIARATVLGRPD